MAAESHRRALVSLLQLAHAGELAAAHAYRGHARSVRDPAERARILEIEEEEGHHRRQVAGILTALGAGPDPRRETRALRIGRTLAFLSRVTPWILPMYGAGFLESRNVVEYEVAARHARDCGREEFVDCLLTMAEVEWEHEKYFRGKAAGHLLPLWKAPPPKAEIRASYARECPVPALS